MKSKRMRRSILTVILSVIMVFEMIAPTVMVALASGGYTYKGGAGTKVSDLDTSTKYSESLGDNASTEYAGRIWTDKSVYTDAVTFATYGGGESTIRLNENQNGEDFLVAYSALASSQSVTGQTQAPIDVVFIIDISGSMSNEDSEMDNELSRIANTVNAVNASIDKLMSMNDYTRISVVAFSNTATVLLPLDRYTKTTEIEREWVQTGDWFWEGYYKETTVDVPYFTLSNSTASGNNATLYTNAVVNAGTDSESVIEKSINVSGGTNIQLGLYTGMNVLATEESTTADINGQMVQRIPSVILLSDGAPTYSSGSTNNSQSNWWAPLRNNSDGNGNTPYYGNGFKALMTGAYMKNAIDDNYNVGGTSYDTTFYTIGMGISELTNYSGGGNNSRYTGEKDLADFTLNPGGNWENTNNMAKNMVEAWTSYTNQTANGNETISVTVDNGSYTVRHPQSPLKDIYTSDDKNALKNLVDSYYGADNASSVTDVFEQIVSSISISAPQIPTEIKGADPMNDGYITYTDPIGEYMEVKDVKAIIYAGHTFTEKGVTTSGNTTTYTFSGTVDSAVYGHQEIKNIIITVTETDGKQTLVIKIPASVIPLRVNEVTLNANGSVKTHTNNGAMPARVVYSVGLQSEILKESDSGVVYVDKSEISSDYLAKNTNADGTINFYSNVYTNTNEVNGATAGDATVEFEPSHSNGFYYILEDMPIYKDAEFKEQVTVEDGIDDDTVYYYKDEYYHGSSVEVAAIERTGAQLKKTVIKEGTDGYLYREAGSPRLNRILKFEGTKTLNQTKTAEDFYAPTFEYAQDSTDPYEGKFVIYQGNNGVITVVAGGNLQISKAVNAGVGLTAPDKEFEFTLDLDGNEINNGTYNYTVVDADGQTVKTGTVSKDSTKITLKDGQTATVFSLPPETEYTVTETAVAGFTSESQGASGTISANTTSTAVFTNTYNVQPVTFPTSGSLNGEKELAGRAWTAKDSFTFFITPYNNEPLPENYDADAGVTVNKPDTTGGKTATFNFGNIEFTAPGTYRYTIVEKEPENDAYLPGMSYSRALYRLVVNVTDNGDGTMKIASYDIQRLYDDDANQLFTYNSDNEIVLNEGEEAQDAIKFVNTYSAEAVTRVPVALKDYTDNSGMNPLVSGMFEFKLEAIGIVENNEVAANSASKVPMPQGSTNGAIITTNEGHNITFPSVSFTQDDIPDGADSVTFRYKMSEVTPANKVNGMTYDTSEYTIDVVLSIDSESDLLNVNAIYPNDERIVSFKNVYTPNPITADINGNKTLNGRDMKSGESFEFSIMGANAATNNAVRNGVVNVPSSTAAVVNGKDGVATSFVFEDIEFKKAGTYEFAITETKGNSAAVEYDDSVITVTVVIDDAQKDGNLEVVSVTYSNGKSATEFVNTYTTEFDGTPISLDGTKNLTGKTLLNGEFYFNVAEYYNGDFVTEGLVSHTEDKTADNGVYTGTISFLDNVSYDKTGEYTYYITEQIPEPKVGGTDYDESQYRYTVKVEDVDKVGKLTVTSKSLQKLNGNVWENADAIVFNNEYEPAPVTAELPLIKKVISGDRSAGLKAGEFEFEMKLVSASPADGIILPEATKVSNAANGDILFDDITFKKAGKYVVSVKEIIPEDAEKLAGITYSTQEITATYTVVDDRNGTLTATLTELVGGDTIVNGYTAESAEVTIDIKKNFTGREDNKWLDTDKFDFEIVILDPDTQAAIENGALEFPMDSSSDNIVKKTIDKNTTDKTVSGQITINRSGTYKFIVREVTGDIPGVHYDSQPREIVIVATDDSTTAEIKTILSVNGTETDDLTLTFNNVYDTTSAEISGHDHLTVEKIFTGREDDAWLDTDEFKFTLEAYDDVTKTAVANNDVELPEATELTISNANKAHPHFGNIIFNEKGTYKFKVTELDNGISGVTYDSDKDRIVTVNVTDNDNGVLVAAIADDSEALTFTNTYSAKEVVLEGKTNLEITKSLVGRKWFSDDKFTFTIAPYGDITRDAVEVSKYVVMPALTEIEVKAESGGYAEDIKAYFGDITFKKAGNYAFTISENDGSIDNIEYDTHTYVVYVKVVDNNEGSLVATASYHNTSIFVNTYTPDAVSAELKGEKKLEGNRDIKAGDFEFTVSAVTDNAPMPQKTTVTNTADGAVDFGKVEFTAAGTYVYEIKETKGNIPGVTYDSKTVTATVTVSYDDTTGKLSANVDYSKEGESGTKTAFTFNNTYKAQASEPISLTAKKKVTPSDGNEYSLKGGEFSFSIVGSQDAPMPQKTTASNDADGNVSFGSVKFTKDGTYSYTISEVQGNLGGIAYDSEVYTVTVTVTDDTAEAKLKASVTITDSDGKEASPLFENKYNPKETSAIIFGSKKLDSEHKQIEADEFEFTIKAVTQNAPMPAEATVKNTATGTFQFGTITYTKLGTYKYEITEKNLGKTGYTYDDTVYTVTVKVTDEGKGQLAATVEGVGTAQNPTIKFVNKYTPKPVSITIGKNGELSKVLDGRDIRAEEFEFAVFDSENKEIATDKNDINGKFEFTFDFDKADTYKYTVAEKNNGVAGVTYDEKVYGVEFVVVDKNGELEVESVTYTDNTAETDAVVFNNTYKADKTGIIISAAKVLEGRDLSDNEFKFVVKDKDGNVLATATNTKDGKIVFDEIELDKAGTYEFTVSEEEGILEYVTYDDTEYIVKVEVVDDGNGKLKAENVVISTSGKDVEEIVFNNKYEEPAPEEPEIPGDSDDSGEPEKPALPQTGDNTNINMWFALLFVSIISFISTVLYAKRRRKCEQN